MGARALTQNAARGLLEWSMSVADPEPIPRTTGWPEDTRTGRAVLSSSTNGVASLWTAANSELAGESAAASPLKTLDRKPH